MSEESQHPVAISPTSNSHHPSPAKVLVHAPNWVGDAVMALPALRELRRIFNGAHIALAARPWVLGLFEGERLADSFISLSHSRGTPARAARFIRETRLFRREGFDFAALLPNSFGTALAARIGGAKRIAGYPTDARRFLLDHVIPFETGYKTLHQVRYYLNIASQIEVEITGESYVNFQECEPRLDVSEDQRQRAKSLLERFRVNTEGGQAGILVINPGATNSSAKRWPAERFANTADLLAERMGVQTVIVGAAGDLQIAEDVASLMRTDAAVLAGQTSIAELKAVLACACLVISNDTGTSHVSAALGVPTVVVFGPTEHVSTRPLSRRASVVRHDVECSPCMLRECPIDHRCMTRVGVDDVYAAAQALLVSASS